MSIDHAPRRLLSSLITSPDFSQVLQRPLEPKIGQGFRVLEGFQLRFADVRRLKRVW
jgi:hypothetical protein